MGDSTAIDFGIGDLLSPEHRQDPHPLYHRIRATQPVWFVEEFDEYVLTRYADCEPVLRDPRFSSDPGHRRMRPELQAHDFRERLEAVGAQVLLFLDPPDHTRLRRLVTQAFTPKAVERLRPRVQEIVDSLLGEAEQRGELDIVGDYGYVVPVTVICEMLGVPVEDRLLFRDWSSNASRLLDGDIDAEVAHRGLVAALSLINYLNGLIEERRREPRDDLLSALIAAEEEGDKLTEQELRSTVLLLFVAGHETTMNLIGNGTHALLRNRDEMRRLVDNPSLAARAVEEVLRYDGPVHVTGRTATENLEVGGVTIERGQGVVTLLAAANRDPERFADPDRLDVGRPDNHHLGFGQGMHFCLGASLARVEGQVAIGTLVRRFPRLELLTEAPRYRAHFVLRGLEELRVAL